MLYELNFKTQTESFVEDNSGNEESRVLYSGIIGKFVCTFLSVDFNNVTYKIADLIFDCVSLHKPFPESEITLVLESILDSHPLGYFRDMSYVLELSKNIYAMLLKRKALNDRKKEELCIEPIYDRFRVFIALQAYLDECEQSPKLSTSRSFESFSEACLNIQILKQRCAMSLNENQLLDLLSPNCNAHSIVNEQIKGMIDSDDSIVIMSANRSVMTWQLIAIESIYYIFDHNLTIKRCKNCGKFFIPLSRSDELYCDNPSPQDNTRTCKKYGSERLWYERLKNDEAAKLSRNVYMAKQMLAKRNPDIIAYTEMLEFFKTERKKWELAIKTGKKTKNEYIDWLNEIKGKKTIK